MRKYIIFLILLSIAKTPAATESCGRTVIDGYSTGKCQNADGSYKDQYQRICWHCVEAPGPTSEGSISWGKSKRGTSTHGYLTGKVCPKIRGTDFYVWRGDYPPKALYALRSSDASGTYGPARTELKRLQDYGFVGDDPCTPITSAAASSLPTHVFATCVYTIMCKDTREADPYKPPYIGKRKKIEPPPADERDVIPRRSGRHYRRHAGPPPKPIPGPGASSALVDFDDMLYYYIGGISDYLNNEYYDDGGDDPFEEMLIEVYMEGYKAGLNVEKCN